MLHNVSKVLVLSLALSASSMAVADSSTTQAVKHIDVFTTTTGERRLQVNRLKQLTNMPVNVHYVDALNNFQQYLGGTINLNRSPTKQDIDNIKKSVQKKLNGPQTKSERTKLQAGLTTYQKVKALGIKKVPAIVFEDKYVVYGIDAIKAIKIYNQKASQ